MHPNVNYALGLIMISQCRLMSCDKCTILGRDVDNGEDYACTVVEGHWEIAVP